MSSFTIHDLARAINRDFIQSDSDSNTRKMYDKGLNHIAKKVAEEGVEFSLALVVEDRNRTVEEGADLIYRFLVALAVRGIPFSLILAELERRTQEPRDSRKAIP